MDNNPRKQRRQRAILSCNDCRRRKLRCDRLDPCNRCIKGGIAHSCAYGSEAHSIPPDEIRGRPIKRARRISGRRQTSHVARSLYESDSDREVLVPVDKRAPNTSYNQRFQHIDNGIAQHEHVGPSGEQLPKDQVEFLARSPELKGISRSSAVMGMSKGRGFGTQFYGTSAAMSAVAHFPALRLYMKAIYSDSIARRLSQDIKASEDRARLEKSNHRTLCVPSLRSLLPDRNTVDHVVNKYFDTFETTYRIVHVPSFRAAYETYWDPENFEDSEMDALILAILACTICLSTHTTPRYNHIGSTFHSKAYIWAKACEAWLRRQSNKHRSLASIQVRCLRLLALATASIKAKEYYQEVQAHVSIMRSAGLHIDPSIFGSRCSPFEGEMRRRLWATTMELELQASIDKGTPSILGSLSYDCAPPRNINDVELHPDMEEVPSSRVTIAHTDTAFLHLSMQTLELRIDMCHQVNDLKESPDKYDALEYEDTIRSNISKFPRWTDPKAQHARILLELQLTQFLIILHAPRVQQVDSRRKSNCRYGMVTALEAAARTIDLHNSLAASENYALVLTRNDYFRSILQICHVAYYARMASDTVMIRLAKLFFDDSVKQALILQEERAMRPGRGSEFFWYVSAAVSLTETQFRPSQADELTRQAVDRVSKLLYKILSLHDDPSEETLATEVMLEGNRMNVPIPPGLHNSEGSFTANPFADAGLRLDTFDYGGTSDFMMDDFWFFNVPPFDFDAQSYAGF
ncbi:hypothetical protein CC86DRAFT_395896 [Ophiobolus disseminans]|uniref:Zn(2)-C6 fungal-type domain-containing protein n=1 Tax=Ophiobolus disseminans TaxID=1469910 RepID=A0A6A6ZS17_9PLEO|nr:hypothetical protein CC86DRAFT_395896 [Ophiobolus disseminans]